MPRCQWCRQESQDQNICDWCKRPLAAGWTPAAATSDRMTFSGPEEEPNSDRLLMFSMVGIVAVIGVAFAFSFLSRKKDLPAVQPAAPPIQQPVAAQPPQQPVVIQSPMPGPYIPQQQAQPYSSSPPVYYTPPPVVDSHPRSYVRRTGNRKLDGLSDSATDVN